MLDICIFSSALRHSSFVTTLISELLTCGRIKENHSPSFSTGPLSVVCQSSRKNGVISDLGILNDYVQKDRFRIHDWKIGLQYISPSALLFSFDLKSGYHHKEIA